MITLPLTEKQLSCLRTVLQWADAAGDHSELFEAMPRTFRRTFNALLARVDAAEKLRLGRKRKIPINRRTGHGEK